MNAPLTAAPKIECSPEEWAARVDLACAYRAVAQMRRLEMSCETQVLAQSGGAKLIFPPMDVVRKTSAQTTQIVHKEKDTGDGPAMLWAAVRRWMEQIDPSYMH